MIFSATVTGFGHSSTKRYHAASADEAREKALVEAGVSVEVKLLPAWVTSPEQGRKQ